MSLKTLNSHERDSRITFDEEPHVYYIDDKPYDLSVTGFIHTFFEKFDVDAVINKNYNKWQSNPLSKYNGLSVKEIKAFWERNANEASSQGSKLHRDIELFYNDMKIVNNSAEFQFFLNFNNKIPERYRPYRTEWMIYDKELKLNKTNTIYLNIVTYN